VKETKPITVEYEITPYDRSLEAVIIPIIQWDLQHRKEIMKGG
jgi:DNA-binding HxlR family transcriptional regulator